MKNIWKLLQLLPDFRKRAVGMILVNVFYGAVIAATPYVLKVILDQVVTVVNGHSSAGVNFIWILLAILVGVRLLENISDYIQERTGDLFFVDTMSSLREKVFSHLLRLSIDFYEGRRVGEIIQRVTSGVLELARWTNRVLEGMLSTLVSLIFMLILLWLLVPKIGLIMTIIFPLNLYLTRSLAIKMDPIRKTWLSHIERALAELTETLSHIATVRSFGREEYKAKKYTDANEKYRAIRTSAFRMEWNRNLARQLINTAAVALSLYIVVSGAIEGRNSIGDIFLVALYIQRLINNIGPLNRLITDTAEVETTCERLSEILDNQQLLQDLPDATELKELESIEFRNVSFNYPGKSKPILKSVSFKIDRGNTLALVGPSGVGKTTITKLLLRFYEASTGEILINNQPINSYIQASIREILGTVMQDVALFNDSIEENIRFANPAASRIDLEKAAVIAHADEFIKKLPEKYQTVVGERGIKLSGGEKQRVAIARAILRDPQLVILDEATSALDSESEKYVQDGLHKLLQNRTAIIIAHRLSTVMRADIIIVLKNGVVEEQGNHQELIKKKGLYAKLFSMQSDSLRQLDLTPVKSIS